MFQFARARLPFVPWRIMRWPPQAVLTRGISVDCGHRTAERPTSSRVFRIDGPVHPDSSNQRFAIPSSSEDLTTFYRGISEHKFLLCYGPSQSGKSTVLLALARRVPSELGLRVRVVDFRRLHTLLAFSSFRFELKEFISELTLDDNSVLLIEDFHVLLEIPPLRDDFRSAWGIAQHEIMQFLRFQKIANPRASAIAFGNTTMRYAQPHHDFDIASFTPVPAFTLEQTRELFAQFERERGVPVDTDVVADIHTMTQGHRGLVGDAGIFIDERLVTKENRKSVTKCVWASPEVRNTFLHHLRNSPVCLGERAIIETVDPPILIADVVGITARIPVGGAVPLSDVETGANRRVIDMMADVGFLIFVTTSASLNITFGPPILQRLLGYMFRPVEPLIPFDSEFRYSALAFLKSVIKFAIPLVRACWILGCVKVCHTPAQRRCPSEDAYAIAVHAVLSGLVPPTSIVPQTSFGFARRATGAQATAAFDLDMNMPTGIGGGRTFIAYAAHAGPAELEARVRRLEECLIAAPEATAWIISFEFRDVMDSRPPPPPSPHVNVLCVYYNMEAVKFEHVPPHPHDAHILT